MECIDLALTAFTRRSRSVTASHRAAGLSRGLEPGEFVLVRDPADDEHFTATVADIHFELEDTVYRLELGTRVTAGEAAEWLSAAVEPAVGGRVSARQLMDMLSELRRGERALEELLGSARRG